MNKDSNFLRQEWNYSRRFFREQVCRPSYLVLAKLRLVNKQTGRVKKKCV